MVSELKLNTVYQSRKKIQNKNVKCNFSFDASNGGLVWKWQRDTLTSLKIDLTIVLVPRNTNKKKIVATKCYTISYHFVD